MSAQVPIKSENTVVGLRGNKFAAGKSPKAKPVKVARPLTASRNARPAAAVRRN